MTQLLPLRNYQREAIDAVKKDMADGFSRLALVLATGSGKTVIFSHLIAEQHEFNPHHKRSLVLAHRDELVLQAVDKISQVAPGLSVGVVKADRDEHDADVVVASVQTLVRPGRTERLTDVGLVITDECHHISSDSYRSVLTRLGCFDEADPVPMIGVTATLARNDEKRLSDVIEKVSYTKDILELISEGHLVPVRGRRVRVGDLDLSDIRLTRGDFAVGELGDELADAGAGQVIAKAYTEYAADRAGVIFAPSVATAHLFAQDMREAGITCEPVWGDMPLEDRRATLKRFTAGDIQVLSNAMLLTEGWDAPHVSCAVIARPTTSAPLYVQMCGRVLRTYPGKADALILDVIGASADHRLANLSDLSDRTRDKDIELIYGEGEGETDLEELIAGAYADQRKGASGSMSYDDVDLFAASKSAWLQTVKGVWFIPTATGMYFLWPKKDGQTFYVYHRTRGGYNLLHDGLTLSYAMSWAENYAREDDDQHSDVSISGRQAAWRKKKSRPRKKQVDFALSQGVDVTGNEHVAELSDKISVTMASRALDPKVRA
jgi:superfamily II DNA or RNA helicase